MENTEIPYKNLSTDYEQTEELLCVGVCSVYYNKF